MLTLIKRCFILYVFFAMTSTTVFCQSKTDNAKAPNFFIRDINGKRVELSQLLEKGPVLVNFWALWCIPCLKELPHLNKLAERYRDQGLTVLTINQDDPSSENKVKPFMKGKRYTFQVAIDKDKELWRSFKIVALPTLFLIDQNGTISYTHTGYRPGDEKELTLEVDKLMQNRSHSMENQQ
ncbi:TlpA family protein disulfide reductase [candidate division KSB1 bacterium]|nr:TlpA family protein disulfide reductase [candidate division KSB1 bacterium]